MTPPVVHVLCAHDSGEVVLEPYEDRDGQRLLILRADSDASEAVATLYLDLDGVRLMREALGRHEREMTRERT